MFKELTGLKERSNAFVRDLNVWISIAVADNERLMVDLNREQMRNSRLSTGQPISPPYSDAYAKKKGKREPDLFGKGIFQKEMFAQTNENNGTYFFGSFDFKAGFLSSPRTATNRSGYGKDIFGLMPSNKVKVVPKASKSLLILWQKNVLQKV